MRALFVPQVDIAKNDKAAYCKLKVSAVGAAPWISVALSAVPSVAPSVAYAPSLTRRRLRAITPSLGACASGVLARR